MTNAKDRLARQVAEAMYRKDWAAQALDIKIIEAGCGCAKLSMVVRKDMLNGHQTLHGGFAFALADTAFAYACNSRNQANVAAQCSITYTLPGRLGDELIAKASVQYLAERSGVYDVQVTNQKGEIIALFRGNCRAIKGEAVEGLDCDG